MIHWCWAEFVMTHEIIQHVAHNPKFEVIASWFYVLKRPFSVQTFRYHYFHWCCCVFEAFGMHNLFVITMYTVAFMYRRGHSVCNPPATTTYTDTVLYYRGPSVPTTSATNMITYVVVYYRDLSMQPLATIVYIDTVEHCKSSMQPFCYHHVHWCRCVL